MLEEFDAQVTNTATAMNPIHIIRDVYSQTKMKLFYDGWVENIFDWLQTLHGKCIITTNMVVSWKIPKRTEINILHNYCLSDALKNWTDLYSR